MPHISPASILTYEQYWSNKINPTEIPDESLRRLLNDFLEIKVPLVIWGGAVRDLILSRVYPSEYTLGKLINDIDIAVILESNIKPDNAEYKDFGAPFQALPVIKTCWLQLCQKWERKPEDFECIQNTKVPGLAYPIGMMGLRIIYDSSGNPYPDCFALNNGETFCALPGCLSINCFAMDGFGNIYGPSRYFADFKNRTARMIKPPRVDKYALPIVLRLMDYIRRYKLILEQRTGIIFRKHLHDLTTSPKYIEASLDYPWTQKLLKKEFGSGIERSSPEKIVKDVLDRCQYLLSLQD